MYYVFVFISIKVVESNITPKKFKKYLHYSF